MRRLLLLAAAFGLTSSLITGCKEPNFGNSSNNPEYDAVYNGIVMYADACAANNLALDPIAVIMRFAILQEEMYAGGLDFTESGDEPNWDKLDTFEFYGLKNINKRGFLFGTYETNFLGELTENNVSIKKINDTQYVFHYNCAKEGHTGGSLDSNYRSGKYMIDTKGVQLSETSEAKSWDISIYGDNITFANENSKVEAVSSSNMTASIYRGEGDNDDTFYFSLISDFEDMPNSSVSGYWSLPEELGSVRIEDFKTFLIEDTIEQNFHLKVNATGKTLSDVEMNYNITTPVIFNYTNSPFCEHGGYEEVTILDDTAKDWPSNFAAVETLKDTSKTIKYNGHSFNM